MKGIGINGEEFPKDSELKSHHYQCPDELQPRVNDVQIQKYLLSIISLSPLELNAQSAS
jgi:hypothetical protein